MSFDRVVVALLFSLIIHRGKVYPGTGHEGAEKDQRYNSVPSLTSKLNGLVDATPRPTYLRENDPIPLV
jgi:hypothetical protein